MATKKQKETKEKVENQATENNLEDIQNENPSNEQVDNDDNSSELELKIELLTSEIEELKDKLIRQIAEVENIKRRTAKERLELISTAAEKTIQAVLPVLDDNERAIIANDKIDDIDAIKQGFKSLHERLLQVLKSSGLKEMESTSVEFNPDFHEALTEIPAPSEELKGKVVDTVEKGYLLGDKIIRFAKVVVGK